jgi:cell division protein FtsI (penicillin-binding protein 3)
MHEQIAASDGKTPPAETAPSPDAGASSSRVATNGTVVLDVEQGGIVVPSFAGKTVRAAIELAQDSGLDLDAVGSGLARIQMPAPGTHVASGSRVEVRFGR